MSNRDKPLIMLATYNEIENLPGLVDAILARVPAADILVIDDNSPDGTGQWCDEYAKKDPRLKCLHRSAKLGLGTATIAGIEYAIENDYPYVLNMDADFSHDPKYLPTIFEAMEGDPPVDVMVGSRYVKGGGITGWPIKRHLMSRSVNLASRWLLGLPTHDCSGAYRCYRTELMAKLDFDSFRSQGYVFQEEVLWRLKLLGCRFGETPIVFVNRVHGVSKIDGSEVGKAVRNLLRLGWENLTGR